MGLAAFNRMRREQAAQTEVESTEDVQVQTEDVQENEKAVQTEVESTEDVQVKKPKHNKHK